VIKQIVAAFQTLRDEGLGILLVEQSVPRALAVSDRCYVMERGTVVMSGASRQLADDPRVFAIVRGTVIATSGGDADGAPVQAEPEHSQSTNIT
jgi:branched-chain amino acid transport system ATP-binding protein